MTRSDLRRLPLPDLVNSALVSLNSAQEAIAVLAERIGPTLPAREGARTRARTEASAPGTDVEGSVPGFLRTVYRDFRDEVMSLNPEIESRPSPVKNGVRRYDAFFMRGRNVIYAHFRHSFIRLNFELPPDHSVPEHEVVRSGERDFRAFELRSRDDLETAVRLARETVARLASR